MPNIQNVKVGFVLILLFFIQLMSYQTLATEINDLAVNATTTNTIMVFLDSTFGYFWSILAMFILALGLYYMTK